MNMLKTIMYSCEQVPDFLYHYLEGKLPILTRWRLNLHLRFCPKCRKYLAMYRETSKGASFFEQEPIPQELQQKTLDFLEKEGILDKSTKCD